MVPDTQRRQRLGRSMGRGGVAIALALACALLFGCATTRKGRKPESAGFLTDYDRLEPGTSSQAELIWTHPDVDWSQYDAILLDPVTVWASVEEQNRHLSPEDAQLLANAFYEMVSDRVAQEWKLATGPGPGVLRVQVAIVRLDSRKLVLDVVSSVVPQARALNTLQSMLTDRVAFTGQAAIEARISDAATGEVLLEGADRRMGKLILTPEQVKTWGDVHDIFSYWTDRSIHNLCTVQERPDCPAAPKSL